MILHIILGVLSILSSGSVAFFTGTYNKWYFILIYVIAVPILHIVWFGIYLLILWIGSLILKPTLKHEVEKPNKFCYWLLRQTCFEVLLLFRARVIKGGEEFPKENCLVVQNHTSNFDPMPIIWSLPTQPLICITKPENFYIPIGGPYIHLAGYIDIDRENDFNAVKSIVKAANYLKADKCSIFVCPEGTRNHHPEDGMLEWKAGCLKIAYKSHCPIVVLSLKNANKIKDNFFYKHTNVYMDVCEVIPYEKYKDMNPQELSAYCKNLIAEKLKERS